MLRIAAVDERSPRGAYAAIDPHGRMPGRGAYLCRWPVAAGGSTDAANGRFMPAEKCVEQAKRRNAIARALRRAIPGGLVPDGAEGLESVGL